MPKQRIAFSLLAATLLFTGCERGPSESDAPAPSGSAAPGAPAAAPEADPTRARIAGFAAPKPATWLWQPAKHQMRSANWVVPAASGDNQADLIVYEKIGGGVDGNIARWKQRFRSPEQHAVEPVLTELTVDGITITVVEFQGEHMRMGSQWFTPNQTFIAAIVQAPEGDVHVVLSGQSETVEANREAFMRMIEGLERVDPGE